MSENPFNEPELWSKDREERAVSDPQLVVDVDGFEGPLDLLLELARRQKVDLSKISILALAEQYLEFIEEVRKLRIELAADYLVMAAWLAFLKSKLLLPDAERRRRRACPARNWRRIWRSAFSALKRCAMRRSRLINRNRLGPGFFPAWRTGTGDRGKDPGFIRQPFMIC